MKFKSDAQRKAVMSQYNGDKPTISKASLNTLKQTKPSLTIKKQLDAIDSVTTEKDLKSFRGDIAEDKKFIRENGGREFLYATRPSGTNIITPTMLEQNTDAGFDLANVFIIGDNKKFYHYKDGKLQKLSKAQMQEKVNSFKKYVGWQYDATKYTDGVVGQYFNPKSKINIQLKKRFDNKFDVITRQSGVELSRQTVSDSTGANYVASLELKKLTKGKN